MIMIKTKIKRLSYQSGFIQWRKNGCPTLRFRERDINRPKGWKERRVTLPPGTTAKQARKKLDELIAIANATNADSSAIALAPPPVLTFADFMEGTLWKSYLAKKKVKPSTLAAYDSMIRNHVLPHIGSMALVNVTPAVITDVLDRVRTKSSKYCLNLYNLLNVLFEVASQHDLISDSPVRRKLHRPIVEKTEKTSYTKDQIRLLSEYILPEYRLLLFTAAIFGLRLGELLAIRWQDIDGDVLHIRHSLWRRQLQTPKTNASKKALIIPELILGLLHSHKEASRWVADTDFVFCRLDGTPLDPDHLRNQVLYKALDAAGIPRKKSESGFHALRHAAGSLLYDMRRDLEEVKTFLRHSRIGTTSDIYVHPGNEVSREATEALATLLLGTPTQEEERIQ